MRTTLFALALLGIAAAGICAGPKTEHPKKIYAHYMGCYPAGCLADDYAVNIVRRPRHDAPDFESATGSRWRNYPVLPDGKRLTLEESADLDIRRAIRAGIDGFAMDVMAGGKDACFKMMDALFKVAEEKNYPFELTFCLDDPETNEAAIDYLLKNHGSSPKLARRDGKVFFAGYASVRTGMIYGAKQWNGSDPLNSLQFRATPEGWKTYIGGYRAYEKKFNTPMYFHFCLNGFFGFMNQDTFVPNQADWNKAAGVLAEDFDAVGEFFRHDFDYNQVSRIVRGKGAEWSEPMYYQYENPGSGKGFYGKGTDLIRDRWASARKNNSTLIQFATWNDYTENTMLAPGAETRYTLLDLTAYFVKWWKTGSPPTPDHDRVYLVYRKFPNSATIYPFNRRSKLAPDAIEVLTILPKPAIIRVPGRGASWKAPAGFFCKQLPLTPGPVIAEVVRGGKTVIHLESPEPVTDRPYRDQQGMVCFSTEEMRHWKADFGDAKPVPLMKGEYADDDHDGLPNWFEMYWFGKMLDWSTDTIADPKADPDGDGKTNIEEYLAQTDPTKAPKYDPGYVWDLDTIAKRKLSFNPDADDQGNRVWSYVVKTAHDPAYRPFERLGRHQDSTENRIYFGVPHKVPDGQADTATTTLGRIVQTWDSSSTFRSVLSPRKGFVVAIAWQSPVGGWVKLDFATDPFIGQVLDVAAEHSRLEQPLGVRRLNSGDPCEIHIPKIAVRAGDKLYIAAEGASGDLPVKDVRITLLGKE